MSERKKRAFAGFVNVLNTGLAISLSPFYRFNLTET